MLRRDLDGRKGGLASRRFAELLLHHIELCSFRVAAHHVDLVEQSRLGHEQQVSERIGATFLQVGLRLERRPICHDTSLSPDSLRLPRVACLKGTKSLVTLRSAAARLALELVDLFRRLGFR